MKKRILQLLLSAGIVSAFGGNVIMPICSAESENAPITAETESITEEKLREILPKTIEEFTEFTEKNGIVSVHGNYIVYCDKINYSTGAEVVMEQLGTAEIKEAFKYNIKTDEPLPPGSSSTEVIVYEAVSSGTVKVTISQGRVWEWEQSHQVKDLSFYEVNADMTVTKINEEDFVAPVRGDANGDGIFSIADFLMLEKWLLGEGELTCWKNVDLCKDSVIDVYDFCIMRTEVSESKPDYTVLSVELMRGNNSIDKVQKSIYTASSMAELYTLLSTAESCEFDGCSCGFDDVRTLVPNGVDEKFFEANVLIAVYNRAEAGNVVLNIDRIEKTDGLLTVYTTTEYPEYATPDMAYYRGFIAVSKTYFEGVSKVERNDTEIRELSFSGAEKF